MSISIKTLVNLLLKAFLSGQAADEIDFQIPTQVLSTAPQPCTRCIALEKEVAGLKEQLEVALKYRQALDRQLYKSRHLTLKSSVAKKAASKSKSSKFLAGLTVHDADCAWCHEMHIALLSGQNANHKAMRLLH